GIPALVLRHDSPSNISFAYFRKTLLPHAVPEVSAASALAADIETGEILFEKNKNDAYPTASLTKLMTAVIAKEEIKPDRLLAVGDEALATYGNSAQLSRGEVFRADDLLHGLILESSNDIAMLFQLAVPRFIDRMNEIAKELGLAKTFYEDTSGLSRKNITSAGDLFSLMRRIDTAYPELLTLSQERIYTITSSGKKKIHAWRNVNWPAGDRRYLGGKAGFTDDSLQTMAGIWSTRMAEYGGRRIAITLMGSRNRVQDTRAIIAYLEKNFVYGFATGADAKSRSASFSGSEGAAIYPALAGFERHPVERYSW
ncbi:MAG: serine hydrolase, partial [Candidatus Sungiibacteriota bacterium]